MISLFRKIRQNLLTQNRVTRYLAYALGEILLVVIGILFALSINTWNENRKQNELKMVYISRLISDIQQDTLKIQLLKKQLEDSQEIIKNTINILNSEADIDEIFQSMKSYFDKGWMVRSFLTSDNTYLDLEQTGNMGILKNSVKVEDIIQYYTFIRSSKEIDQGNREWLTPLDHGITEKTPALELDPTTQGLFKTKDTLVNVEKILAYKELLERGAAAHYYYNQSLLNSLTAIEKNAKILIQTLDSELK
jgi:hypothetical protein